jgi:hypothetical protein
MRPSPSLLLALACGCSSGVTFVPFDVAGAGSALFVVSLDAEVRTIAVDQAALYGDGLLLPFDADLEVFFFAARLDALRVGEAPALLGQPRCAADTLTTAEAFAARCGTQGQLEPCNPAERLVAREPYLGVVDSCAKWTLDDLVRLPFDLPDVGAPLGATVLTALDPSTLLLGQHAPSATAPGGFEMVLARLDTAASMPGIVAPTPLTGRLPGVWSVAVGRDAGSAWLIRNDGAAAIVDVSRPIDAPRLVVEGPGTRAPNTAARSPVDPDQLLMTTSFCGLVRREGQAWKTLVADVDATAFTYFDPRFPCTFGQVEWSDADEALVVGVAAGPAPRDAEALSASLRQLLRVRGDEVVPERLPWPPDRPAGFLTSVASYRADDGARVEVATGFSTTALQSLERQDLWFVKDPRRGQRWVLIRDPDETFSGGLTRLTPWARGLIGSGSFLQGFDDLHWVRAGDAAISRRSSFRDLQVFGRVVVDGRGGFVLASSFPDYLAPRPERFVWHRRR